MKVATVINQNEQVFPIVDGNIIRIYDMKSNKYKDYENPAIHLTDGGRVAALNFAIEKGVSLFAAPSQTFCEQSYKKAREEAIRFYRIGKETLFDHFQQIIINNYLEIQDELPDKEIVQSIVLEIQKD